MASLNKKIPSTPIFTHEGAKATKISPEKELRRSVFSTFLWENSFYESGVSIADRIKSLIPKVDPKTVSEIAIEARLVHNLRHVPLLIAREMARYEDTKPFVAETLEKIICRPDELTEFLSIYWKEKKCPIANQVKKGLAKAFTKFNEYSLAKYNRENAIKLRDVLFLVHAKPKDDAQADLWKRLVAGELVTPDTWEVELSKGGDKKASWTRLLEENKLGGMALLKNFNNFQKNSVDRSLIKNALSKANFSKVLPFRFISAAKFAPDFESELEEVMFKNISEMKKLSGKTLILVDVSGSMDSTISEKSDLMRLDAACGVAMIVRELCDDVIVYSFSNSDMKCPNRRGFSLKDAIVKSQPHGGTDLGRSLKNIHGKETYDRIIVITDEQSHTSCPDPIGKNNYMINVASYKNGIGYGKWTHLDGFSESVVKYISEIESFENS